MDGHLILRQRERPCDPCILDIIVQTLVKFCSVLGRIQYTFILQYLSICLTSKRKFFNHWSPNYTFPPLFEKASPNMMVTADFADSKFRRARCA